MIDKKNTVKGKTPIMVKEIKTDRIFKKKNIKIFLLETLDIAINKSQIQYVL